MPITPTPKREAKKKAARCRMVTYGGFIVMAGPAPKMKPERCMLPPLANGFCEKHNPENW